MKRKILSFKPAQMPLGLDMHTHRPLRYSRDTLLRSAFKSPASCVGFTVETRHAIDQTMRGGDLFEVYLRADGSAAILIADVSSKAMLSIVHTEMMRRAFRMCASTERSPASMMSVLNGLRFDGPPPYSCSNFASAVIVAFERGAAICKYASAGHDVGLFINGRKHRHVAPTGPVLGVINDATYTDCMEQFGQHDLLLLGTDGFTECRDQSGRSRQFGTTGIVSSISDEVMRSCATVAHTVARSADVFTGGHYRDDATLAVIMRTGAHGTAE